MQYESREMHHDRKINKLFCDLQVIDIDIVYIPWIVVTHILKIFKQSSSFTW